MRHVITLSTIPPRFDRIGPVLKSLVRQKIRPEAVELYIPRTYRRFPQWGGGLPEFPEGVTVVRVDEDLGPATKVLPAAKAYRGQDIEILYVDDDWTYPRHWTSDMQAQRRAHPGTAICAAGFELKQFYGYDYVGEARPRAIGGSHPKKQASYWLKRFADQLLLRKTPARHRFLEANRFNASGYIDIGEGFGGVMVRPEFFDDLCYTIPPVLWTVDDIWISGMLERRGIRIWAEKELWTGRRLLETTDVFALGPAVIEGADRTAANRACIDYMRATYGIWGGVATQRD